MKPNPVVWFEIYVDDMKRARAFYETVLGAKLERLEDPSGETEMWAFSMEQGAPGAMGALVRMKGVKAGGSSVIVYFSCDDVKTEAGRVTGAGGTISKDKMSIGQYGFIALVTDTEGNTIGLHSMK
ncbi:MAG TPA: VOC family protein [Casimicrobiaceae bacterium]|nr:VOC family protein [Casimicrobiaceae bacterium]